MGLVAGRSRSMAFGDELLELEGDLCEHLGDDAWAQGGGNKCPRRDATQGIEASDRLMRQAESGSSWRSAAHLAGNPDRGS